MSIRSKISKSSKTPIIYPIPKNPKIERFWQRIKDAKEREIKRYTIIIS